MCAATRAENNCRPGSGSSGTLAERWQLKIQQVEQALNVFWLGVGAHQANAPDATGQITQTIANLNTVLIQQVGGEGFAIDTIGDLDGGQGGQPVGERHVQLKAHALQASPQLFAVAAVASPGILEPLLTQQTQGLTQAVVHVHRSGVVIRALTAPVGLQA